ncbi:MAG TPA: hypothetical protein VK502_02270 [Candidatus Saccharimonadales bacterium]|nr:hypothetical protein [Candidatus Saccharimonadales bacterium]
MSILHQLFFTATEKIDAGSIGIPVTNADNSLAGILTTIYTWAGIICVVVIIIAGFFYTTSNSDASQIKRAKDAIVGSCIGLIIILMAFVITQFVIGSI